MRLRAWRTGAWWLWSTVMGLLICGPLLLSRGFALTHDMVFVPRQPFKAAWLGLDGSVPRAVPSDALVSMLSTVVPGDLLQKGILLGLLVLAGGGAATVVSGGGLVARLSASTLYIWNPYVFERLAMGQWALLCGYAALPWAAIAAARIRGGRPGGWPAMGVCVSLAAFTSPTGGVLSSAVCCCLLVGRDRATTWRAVGLSVAVNLPWIVPSVLQEGGIASDPEGVAAFAAHPDTPYGVVGSLLSLGGIWNGQVVAPGRDSWLLSGCLALVCLGAVAGLRWTTRVNTGLDARRVALIGGLGLALALLPVLPGALTVVEWVDVHVPGAGLLRDSQKWVALLALGEAVGVAAAVTVLRERWRRYGGAATWWVLAAAVLVPLGATASLGWGLAGRIQPATYPRDWAAVAAIVDTYAAEGGHGDVAVLPWSIYRQYAWNDNRPVLDPAPRYLAGDVVIADTLVVGRRAIAGEDERSAQIGGLLARDGDVTGGLRRLGIGLVVVERHTPGVGAGVTLRGHLAYDGDWLRLWELGSPAAGPAAPSVAARALIVLGDVTAGGVLAGSVGLVAASRARRYTRR